VKCCVELVNLYDAIVFLWAMFMLNRKVIEHFILPKLTFFPPSILATTERSLKKMLGISVHVSYKCCGEKQTYAVGCTFSGDVYLGLCCSWYWKIG
jgi:hypothetical protein